MSASATSTIRLAIRTKPENFERSRIVNLIETIEKALYEGGVYASATAGSLTIEITVRTDQLLDTAKVLNELELV
jgi:2-keto-3-deoxy-6-phosphogluconate aldolase